MIRKIMILSLVALMGSTSLAVAQNTTLKWNALYWTLGIPNISVETRLGEKFTFNADVVVSPWESIKGKPLLGLQLIPEVRFYPKEAFKGFYAGLYAAYDSYEVSKWNYTNDYVQHGIGISLGVTLGWQIDISHRWGMDFYVGGGWHHGWYYGIDRTDNSLYAPWNKSGEWIPYKAGVAFTYRLGMGKK